MAYSVISNIVKIISMISWHLHLKMSKFYFEITFQESFLNEPFWLFSFLIIINNLKKNRFAWMESVSLRIQNKIFFSLLDS